MPAPNRPLFRTVSACAAVLAAALPLLASADAKAANLVGDAASDFSMTVLVDGLTQPTDVAIVPDGRAIVTQRLGDVAVILPNLSEVDGHINVLDADPEQGLLGVVADPNFASNHYLYFYASIGDENNRHKVVRYTLGDDSTLSGATTIVDMGLMGPKNHNGGGLSIHNGQLYIAVGDTGHNLVITNNVPDNHIASCLNFANGKVLRVNLDGTIPTDNPLYDTAMATGCADYETDYALMAPDKRIYAWGLRNPFRVWADPVTGLLWIGDVGEAKLEEISVGGIGTHFGYPFVEGTHAYTATEQPFQPANTCNGMTPAKPCTAPVYEYDHSNGNNAIIGGQILDGCEWPAAWKSRYIFGDNGSGSVWTVDVNTTRDGVVANSRKDFASTAGVAAFKLGPDNALYIVEALGNAVQRITANGAPTSMATCPVVPIGGTGGTGGMSAGGGAGGVAGSAAGGVAGVGVGGSGGLVGTGGAGAASPGTGGGTSAASRDTGTAQGCGCRVGSSPANTALGLLAFAGALGLLLRRRKSS